MSTSRVGRFAAFLIKPGQMASELSTTTELVIADPPKR
jgi:hypothetical protein